MISDVLFDALEEMREYLDDTTFSFYLVGPHSERIFSVMVQMEALRKLLDTPPSMTGLQPPSVADEDSRKRPNLSDITRAPQADPYHAQDVVHVAEWLADDACRRAAGIGTEPPACTCGIGDGLHNDRCPVFIWGHANKIGFGHPSHIRDSTKQ